MNEVLNEEQILERYPDEWVLVGNLETDEFLHITAGTVLFHSKDRDEVGQKSLEIAPQYFAVFYTGEGPEHILINHGLFF